MKGTGILRGVLLWGALLVSAPLLAADTGVQDFVSRASATGLATIDAAKMALSKSRSADVKTFAVHLIDDNTKAQVQLKTLAESRQLQLAEGPDETDSARLKELETRQDDFDAAFASSQVRAQEEALQLFSEAAQQTADEDLRQFAQNNLAVLRLHLQMARQLAEAHGDG
ncbi:putative membrane protein [Pseudomonas citronellolis]|uniref:DUF4142 domain-containing protein n=1 Tax=Pseudomonas citronellolis TaxID=53408 RepID=UPI0020A06908|nr:DUF4142 domain-containing protein [Pseudomonas citronellolis]MCP1643252.1 putative membrane protein [Pseudomonas citronellolis]MCP1666178.1 putative membrane protein [Pseudomonas citronellolis]MCP1698091.1 putative membrane protein [Pseudomonas citronellolis]MCP1703925.1 putative membrane protein [Pseudomonas citronellolis]MCP1797725.1 putative membrane protein [Pseudomonas citronellolis]